MALTALVCLSIACSAAIACGPGGGTAAPSAKPRRIVSLVPALTEILFAIGAGPQVVGVSSYDEFPPEVKKLPRVGALLDPDVERILSLRPDLVFVYGSQTSQQAQFERAGIRTVSYRHGGVSTALDTIEQAGSATGHTVEAKALTDRIRSQLDAVRARVAGRPRPRVLLVFERQPGTLRDVYASGGIGFLHELLEIAGGDNVFADVARESVQPSQETLLERSPEGILEVRAEGLIEAPESSRERDVWAALPSIAAIRSGRVYFLSGPHLVVPGPRVGQAAEDLARVLHPPSPGDR